MTIFSIFPCCPSSCLDCESVASTTSIVEMMDVEMTVVGESGLSDASNSSGYTEYVKNRILFSEAKTNTNKTPYYKTIKKSLLNTGSLKKILPTGSSNQSVTYVYDLSDSN